MKDSKNNTSKNSRKLSRFLCEEMLYDYETGQLDAERSQAVEEFLAQDAQAREELQRLKDGVNYCQQLAKSRISEPFFDRVRDHKSWWLLLLNRIRWAEMPEFFRWTIEALVVSAIVAAIAIFVPWSQIFKVTPRSATDIVLAELEPKESPDGKGQDTHAKTNDLSRKESDRSSNELTETDSSTKAKDKDSEINLSLAEQGQSKSDSEQARSSTPSSISKNESSGPSQDDSFVLRSDSSEEGAPLASSTETREVAQLESGSTQKSQESQSEESINEEDADDLKEIEAADSSDETDASSSIVKSSSSSREESEEETGSEQTLVQSTGVKAKENVPASGLVPENKKALNGYVYRVFMNLDKLDIVTTQMADAIKKLGGEKAGQVELGWRKPKGSYFHFTLPEDQYRELVKSLKTFGPVRIYRDPHHRVMPEGQLRFILWVEDKDLK